MKYFGYVTTNFFRKSYQKLTFLEKVIKNKLLKKVLKNKLLKKVLKNKLF